MLIQNSNIWMTNQLKIESKTIYDSLHRATHHKLSGQFDCCRYFESLNISNTVTIKAACSAAT